MEEVYEDAIDITMDSEKFAESIVNEEEISEFFFTEEEEVIEEEEAQAEDLCLDESCYQHVLIVACDYYQFWDASSKTCKEYQL